jgi:exodeoxyribonuclease VII large subunit
VNKVLADGLSDRLVQGEISGLSDHPTGVYFSLKDEEDESVLSCYLPRALYYRLGIILDDGLKVKVSGAPNVWKAKGRFSLKVITLELVGEGSLKQAYEKLKLKLEGEGLFARKRELPEFISRIGVITSKTGAVINDFRNNLAKLGFEILFFDSRVEGAYAVEEIRRGIKWFNEKAPDLDVLVLIRGGGSLEDLQAFNNELLARDLFASRLPTICGIGHDRDVPIASLIADAAASTPTAAAQLINHSWDLLIRDLPMMERTLLASFERVLDDQRNQASRLAERMLSRLQAIINRFNSLEASLKSTLNSLGNRIQAIISKVGDYERILQNASPERNLKLGYSIVTATDGRIIRSIAKLKSGDTIKNRFADGTTESTINNIIK